MLLVGLLLSAIATRYVQANVDRAAEARVQTRIALAQQELANRMGAYISLIEAAAALFAASEEVTPAEFRRFVVAQHLHDYAGIQGLGFSLYLRGDGAEREATARALVGPTPFDAPPDRGRHSVIVVLEPLDPRNRAALGYDGLTEPVRREAMLRSRDTGQPTATGFVLLFQDIAPDRERGFLIYVPIYEGGAVPPTVEERERLLIGWAFSAFRGHDLLTGLFQVGVPFEYALYAGERPDERWLLVRSDGAMPEKADFREVRSIVVAGQVWTLEMYGRYELGETERLGPPLVFAAGAMVTLLLFGIVWSQVRRREVAEDYTARLLASETERSRLLEAERASREEAEAARQRAAFLAELSSRVAASLTAADFLEQMVHAIVPFLGDACIIDLFGERGRSASTTLAHRDPAAAAWLRDALESGPAGLELAELRKRAAEKRSPIFRSGREIAASGRPEGTGETARLAFSSVLVVPLLGRERPLGTLTLLAERPDRYGPADEALAVDLARRVTLAVEYNRLFADVQEAVRVRDEFLTIASHELRTPLTALQAHLQGMLSALHRDAPLDARRFGLRLETAIRQTLRLGRLVAELLDVTRLGAGPIVLHPATIDLGELTREVAAGFADEARRAGSPISVAAPPGITGHWDRTRLEQVIANLLSNAIKYGAGRPVEVRVSATDGSAELVVRDYGIGIAPDAQERIFARFERAASQRHYGGLGLGLYLTRQIVAAHGGTIGVESEPGKGSTFRVTLPRS